MRCLILIAYVKSLYFFDKNEGPCGTLSEQSISCFSHCALCSYRGIGEICKSLERERNLPPVIEHTHSPHTPSLLCFKFSTHSFFMRVSKAPSIPSMFYKKFLISSENSYNINHAQRGNSLHCMVENSLRDINSWAYLDIVEVSVQSMNPSKVMPV